MAHPLRADAWTCNDSGMTAVYPGRICLIGEHCDWYGGASLAAPLPMTIAARTTPAAAGLSAETVMDGVALSGAWPGPGVARDGGPLRFIPAAAAVLAEEGIAVPPVHLTLTADLPTGRGFSSSAALCLAVCDALAQAAGAALSAERLAELAFVVEHDRLGIACGRLDQLACAARMPVFLRWEDGRAPLQRVVPAADFYLVAAAFSAPRDTPGILAALHRPLPQVDAALAVFAEGAAAGAAALERGDAGALGAAMNDAQSAYETLLEPVLPELAAPMLRRTCAALRLRGALGAKFSGAGGDGSVIALLQSAAEMADTTDWLRQQGLAAWAVPLTPPGATG